MQKTPKSQGLGIFLPGRRCCANAAIAGRGVHLIMQHVHVFVPRLRHFSLPAAGLLLHGQYLLVRRGKHP